jgi:hypothetical protein
MYNVTYTYERVGKRLSQTDSGNLTTYTCVSSNEPTAICLVRAAFQARSKVGPVNHGATKRSILL